MDADVLALRDALARHLADNGFSPDGGLNDSSLMVLIATSPWSLRTGAHSRSREIVPPGA